MDGLVMLADAGEVSPSISLVLPAYNEEDSIEHAIEEADQALSSLTTNYEIIVVDDGSTDQTLERALSVVQRNPRVRMVRHVVNRGYGAAIRTGFEASTKTFLAFTDSDSQFNLRELDRHLLLIRDYDIVCGYRIDRKDNWLRCLYSRVYNGLVRTLLGTGVRDVDCALKLFRREVFQKIEPTTNGFLINAETITLARQAGLSVVEVGVSHRPRVSGSSTVSIRHIPIVLASLVRFWWNRVFCGPSWRLAPKTLADEAGTHQRVSDGAIAFFAIVGVVAALLLNLRYPLIPRDETRYAEIPREMVVQGDWIVPRLNFEPYYDKPPLFYWLGALSYRVFGVSEWSVRLVPSVSACILLAMVTLFARRHLGRRSGWMAGLVLFATAGFVFCSRFLIIDMVLTLFTTASSLAFYCAVSHKRLHYGWWIASAVACGFGLLTKGPVAVVLVFPPALVFLWLSQPAARPKLLAWISWFVMSLAIPLPWCLAIQSREPAFAYEFFVRHNMSRFAGAFHPQPWWYYVPVVLVGGHPWTFLTLPFLQFIASRRQEVRHQRPQSFGFLALQALWCLAFFSTSRCKLPAYILPAAPAMAILLGHYLATHLESSAEAFWGRVAQRFAPYWSMATSSVAGVVLAGIVVGMGTISMMPALIAIVFWFIVLALTVYLYQNKTAPVAAWRMSGAVAGLLCLQVMHLWVPAWARTAALLPSNQVVLDEVRDEGNTIVTFGDEFSAVPYYSRRNDVENIFDLQELKAFLASHERSIVLFDQPGDMEQTRAAFADSIDVAPIDSAHGVYRFQRNAAEAARTSAITKDRR